MAQPKSPKPEKKAPKLPRLPSSNFIVSPRPFSPLTNPSALFRCPYYQTPSPATANTLPLRFFCVSKSRLHLRQDTLYLRRQSRPQITGIDRQEDNWAGQAR